MAPKGHQKWGGRKRGAKNTKTLEAEELRRVFHEQVEKKWNDLIELELQQAMKDIKARHYVLDQIMGKAVDRKKVEADIDLVIDF